MCDPSARTITVDGIYADAGKIRIEFDCTGAALGLILRSLGFAWDAEATTHPEPVLLTMPEWIIPVRV